MTDSNGSVNRNFVRHEPCPKCGSRNNLARYDDGYAKCFSQGCGYYEYEGEAPATSTKSKPKMAKDLIPLSELEVKPLIKRKLNADTCDKWNYMVGTYKGKPVQVANYFVKGQVVAQKVRYPNKDFVFLGDAKKAQLYGQHLWRDGGKMIVITEGEIDALTVSQLWGNKWPVVSIKNGAQGAANCLSSQIGWLEQFETIVLMFDMDGAGQEAAQECAQLFSPGKCKVAALPLKDANAMLQADRGAEVIDAIWGAKDFRPPMVADVDDCFEEAIKMPEMGLSWPWPDLTKLTYGIHRKKAYYLGAGVGIGKTNQAKELQSWLVNHHNLPVGVFMLEEPNGRTLKGIAGKFVGIPFHNPEAVFTQDQLENAIKGLKGKVYLYQHDKWGTDWDSIKSAIRMMVLYYGVKDIFLDNFTVMVADMDSSEANTEVNRIAKQISDLIQELDITIYGYSHLNAPKVGRDHESGGKVLMSQFTGSRALMRFGHYMFGIERNNDPDLPEKQRNIAKFVVLKDREYGRTGHFYCKYEPKTDQWLQDPDEGALYFTNYEEGADDDNDDNVSNEF